MGPWPDSNDDAPVGANQRVLAGVTTTGAVSLETNYLGLSLRSPIVASASPLTADPEMWAEFDAAGVGAIVLPSLFEEQLDQEASAHEALSQFADMNPEAVSGYATTPYGYAHGLNRYLDIITQAKQAFNAPVIASLNGVTVGGWTSYATTLAEAGADALELNVYRIAADPTKDAAAVEQETLKVVEQVVAAAGIPVAVKLSPYWSALANFTHQLVDAGASGVVLFNRFYQPDINLDTLTLGPRLVLSTSDELRLPLRWVALLHGRLDASIAITTGVHTGEDAVKALLSGADVAMTTSALLQHGVDHVATLLAEVSDWLTLNGYTGVAQARGAMSAKAVADPAAYARANYLDEITRAAQQFRRR